MQAKLHGIAGITNLAKKLPPEHTRWKPGQSGNPKGKKKNALSQEGVKGRISDFSQLTQLELQEIANDPKSSWEDTTLAKTMLRAGDDISVLNIVLDRSVGKVKEQKELILPKPTIVQRRDGSQVVLGSEVKQIAGEMVDEVTE